jgi:hypothetical protein
MDKRGTLIIGGLLGAALAIFFLISWQKSAILDSNEPPSGWENAPAVESTPEPDKQVVVTPKTVVTAKHAYRDGSHIIAGEIPLPTPCHILESSATTSVDKKQVFLTLHSSVKTGEMCAQVITPARFKTTIKATKDAKISTTLNGQEVTLNLIEAGPNENLDDFELYIKG